MESNGLSTELTDMHAVDMHVQHTNNLDGLLRDAEDRVIQLDSRDFRHQCYLGEPRQSYASTYGPSRFVFRNGVLIRLQPVADESSFSYT